MGLRYETWTQKDAERELPVRLKEALDARKPFEGRWRQNEQMVFRNDVSGTSEVTVSYDSLVELMAGDLDNGDSWVPINYMFRYLRFLHAQMSANPPSVTPRPTSHDHQDRRAAEVADDLVTYGRRQYQLQEQTDMTTLQTLLYGTGFARTYHDPHAGEVLDTDVRAGTITMSGDFRVRPCLIQDIAVDPAARLWTDVRYVFERHVMAIEEAKFRWPKYAEALEAYGKRGDKRWWDNSAASETTSKGRVAVWEYTERGLPWNGMAGRHAFLLEDGTVLSPLTSNHNPDAILGYHILTDVDVPGQVYGKSFLDYVVRLQDILNRLDSTILDNIQAHGVVRMVVYDAAETDENQLPANAGWNVLNIKGGAAQKPDFINPPTLMPDIYKFRQQLIEGMEAIAGVNEAMFGQQRREMSGFSMQTAINAGNMVRRRLYNKYTLFVESVYRAYLAFVKKYWSDPRKILVTGEEGAFSIAYYSSADLMGGYDIDVEYGATFSLDPSGRREEIMQIMPALKEAGFTMRQILEKMRLNDVSGLFDLTSAVRRRQFEVFDEMIAKYEDGGLLVYIPPQPLEEHEGMLAAAREFRQSAAFKALQTPVQQLIEKHIRARMDLLAQDTASASAGAGSGNVQAAGPVPELGGLGPLPPSAAPATPPVGV